MSGFACAAVPIMSSYIQPSRLVVSRDVALFLDVDGTILDIADTPKAVFVPKDLVEVLARTERTLDGTTRYREPPADMPDLRDRVSACASLPSFDAGNQPNLIQFVVSGRSTDHCKGLTHYTLRGCRENVACAVPDWDFTANPPAWWPCPS